MNKIFKVIWCKSSQVWIAVSELSKVKAISSTSTENKPTSSHSNFIKTIAISLPIATIPSIANAVIGIDTITNGYAYNTGTAVAEQVDSNTTWAYDYKNPGNKSYYDANNPSDRTDGYSSLNQAAYGVAIGRYTNAQNRTQASNGIAIGDYAQATGGLATSIGAFSQAEDIGSTAIGTASRAKGFNSLAMMRQSAAIGDYSAAIGSVAYAKGKASFAFGASATANGNQSIAIGNSAPRTIPGAAEAGNEAQRTKYDGLNNTQTNGERSVAIGSGAQTNGNDSFAFGSLAKTGSFYQEKDGYLGENVTLTRTADAAEKAIAFGTSAMATGNASVAFGYNALGGETNAIAFGVESKAHKADSIAFGSNANATQANSIAFGSNAQALHENVITIGKDSKATKKGAMTIGESAQSNANNSLALGNGTIINQEDIKNPNAKYTNDSFDIENGVVAIANKGKERRLVNLAAGREDTDAVNVKQLTEVNDNLAKSIAGENYNGYSVDATGRYSYKAPDFNIKNQTLHNVKDAVELAQTNYVSVNADKTKQTDADSNYDNLGAKAAGSIALGEFTGTSATATDSVAIGHNTKVNGQNTVAIGANITAATNGSVILGDSSKADGSHATETVASKEIDGHTYTFAGKAKDAGRFVSVGEKGNERQIKNVAAGHVEADSTDAINGSQLYAVASRVEQGWKITAAKTGTGEVSGNAEKKVAMGDTVTLTAGDNIKITQNEKNLTVATKENVNFTTVTTGNTTLGDNGLTINNGPSITQDGINAGDKKITNVSNGTISPNSKDAVNGSQLYATNQNVTNNANNIAKGLNFQGDNTDVTVNRQLGETLNINGGADKNNLSDNNIGVVGAGSSSTSNGGLTVKLAKDLKGLNSVETKEIKLGDKNSNTTIKYDGDRIKYGDKTVANLDDEKHIKPSEYTVDNNGDVTMTYVDGNGNDVANEKAVIKGIAKNDLSNINKAGETKIQNLAKDAIDMENGENTVASHRDVNGVKTFKVDVKGDLANITSITGGANTGKVEFAGDQVVNVAGDNPIKLDAKTGDITGLTNKTLDGADFGTKGRAATEEQLKIVNDSKIGDNNIRLAGNSGKTADQKLSKQDGIEFNVVGGDNAKYVTTTASGANVTVDLTQDTKDKIDNAANKDLSNITNEGKKVITGLGTIVEAADSSVTVTNSTDAVGRTTYKVKANVPGSNAFNIKYKANGANDQTVALTEGLDFTDGNFTTASVGANGVVKYDVNLGKIKNGADGKTGVDGNDGLATVKTVVEAINNSGWLANATKSTGELDGISTATKVKPGAVVNFDAGKNLTVKQKIDGDNHTYTYSLNKDIEVENVVVTGKDGKDGTIGLNGKDGTNGKNGTNRVDIQVEKGVDGVDGQNGADGISRVVYEDGKGKHTVATMEDGLKFKGDDSTVIAKKLNEQLDIIGGATKADLTDNNIGVNHDNGKLKVQLAKNLNLTDTGSIKFGDNNLTINKDGLTINNGPSVTKDGINAGNKAITNVTAGTNATDAVNVSQLDAVKAAERHIKPGEYAVDNSGNVTMTYLDGNGQDVANEKAVITGVAKNDLSNITDAGKKVITGLGSVVKAGQNVTVDTDTDATTGQKTYTVNAIAQNLGDAELAYKSNGDAATKKTVKVSDGLDFTNGNFTTASVDENGVVKYDVNVGEIENGANGKDGKPGVKGNDGLATVKTVVDAINNSGWLANATKSTGELEGTSTATKVKPGAVVNFDAGKNLKVKQTINGDDHTYTYSLDSNLTNLDKVVVNGKDGANGKVGVTITGPNGTKGEDGKVGITGKDGKNAVSIAGKDGVGHIGLTGPKGADGSNGKSIDISTNDGTQTLVNQEPGTDKSQRIVYTPKDKDGNPIKGADGKDIVREVATMDDGLKFKGDDSTVIAKKLNEQLDIIGGATKADLTDNNIGVNHDNGKLKVQLAKNLNLTDTGSIKFGDNNLTINKDGLTINNGPSVTKDGINAGNKAITNVTAGTNATDAVNVSQLDAVKAAERHIKPGEYAVDNSGNVTMTYLDGNGQDVANEKAVITGVAKNDLSNITDAGKKVITGLGSVVKAGQNVTVDTDTDATTGQKTYTVNAIAQNLGDAELAYKSNGDAATKKTVKVSDGLDFTNGNFTTASVDENGVVKYDVNVGEIENGANGKDGKPGVKGNDGLATVKTVVDAINNSGWLANATKSTGELEGTSTATKVKPGAVVNFDAGKNLKVKQTINGDDHTYTYSLDSNLTNLDKVVVNGKDGANGKVGVTITGPNGTKGEDGKVGITGKDGKNAVSIAGKDGVGHIGLTGPKGADGSDGKSIDISTNDGTQTLVNQEPGTDKSQRIVYTPKDKDGNPIKGTDGKDIVREVATMDDGLKFAGDDGQTDDSKVIAKKLNQKVDIVGGADKTKLTENNIGVNNKDGKLNVQLSKDINLTDTGSIKFGDDLTINNNGLTIKDGPSITNTGIDGGNKQIKNVAEGTEDNDAVTVKQLKDSKTALVNGKNTTVTGTGTSADPYKVNVEGALKDITSITNKDGNGKVEFAADQVVNVAGDNPIKLDAKTGDITGLTNKDLNGPTYAKAGRAATEEQLEAKGTQITNNLTAKGLNFGTQSGEVIHKNLGAQLDIVGEGTKADDRYDATNIKTMTKDGKVVVGLAKDLTADNVTVGQKGENGKDGVDGQIGVNGKDGSAVVLNGKDGSIGLNGENGKNSVSIKGDQGPAGVDGKAGETKKRIVYEYKDPKDPTQTVKEDVATLNDGLKFKGDKGDSIAKKLNEELEILGKLDPNAAVTDKNLRVDNDAGKLVLKMAKQLQDLTSATFIDETTDNKSVINGNGLTVTPKDADNTKTVSVTDKGLNNGGNQIVNVDSGLKKADGTKVELKDAEGDTLNNAVNVGDLKAGVAQATTKVAAGKNVTVTPAKNADGSTTYTVATKDDVDFTSVTTGNTSMNDGGITIKATEGGKTNVTLTNKGLDNGGNKVVNVAEGKDDTDAVNVKQLKAAKTEVEAGDNVVVTNTKGSNGQTIYKVSATDNSAHVDGSDAVTVTKAPTTRKNGTTTVTDYKVDLSNKTKGDINKGVDAHDTVNNKGLTFNADKGTTGVKKLGSQVAVNGDNKNIETVADANGVKVKLKDDISVNSVTAKTIKAGDTTINDNGLTIKNGPSVTKDGINAGGSRITNVAPGRDGTDAVNVNQLKKATNEIHNSLNKMDKRRKAGTASALAAAGLMQAYREGQSSVTAGVGQYQNQSAVAVGYSRLSDNGKYGVKVSFTTNTQGEVGGTASAGYFW